MSSRSRARRALDDALAPHGLYVSEEGPPVLANPNDALPPPPVIAPIDAMKALRLVCLEEACKLARPGEDDLTTLTRAGRFARFADRGI